MRMKRNLKAIPVLVAGLFTSQLSIAAGSVSADPHDRHFQPGDTDIEIGHCRAVDKP